MNAISAVGSFSEREDAVFQIATPPTLTSQGTSFPCTWRPIAGATGARVDSAVVRIDPATSGDGRSLGVVVGARSGQTEIRVKSPEAGSRIRSIVVPDLVAKRDDATDATLRSESDLTSLGMRLVVAPVAGGRVQPPMVCVRSIAEHGEIPRTLTGGFFSGSVLTVPDLVGNEVAVTLCKKDSPDEFERQTFSHGDVSVSVAPGPTGVRVLGPAGDEVFAFAGPLDDTVRADVRAALERHLAAAVTGPDHEAAVTVKADLQGGAYVDLDVRGLVIERKVPDRVVVDTEGDPVVLDPGLPAAGRPPTRTVADLTVTHLGMALHPLSDALPSPGEPLAGVVVRDRETVRLMPEHALEGQLLRRVAVIGRPLTDCDLRLDVLGSVATVKGVVAASSGGAQVVWFDLGEDVVVEGVLRIGLTATLGEFGWVGTDPRVRFAVVVEPAGTNVQVADVSVAVAGPETLLPGAVLAGSDPWVVTTSQFCEVALANVVEEFAP